MTQRVGSCVISTETGVMATSNRRVCTIPGLQLGTHTQRPAVIGFHRRQQAMPPHSSQPVPPPLGWVISLPAPPTLPVPRAEGRAQSFLTFCLLFSRTLTGLEFFCRFIEGRHREGTLTVKRLGSPPWTPTKQTKKALQHIQVIIQLDHFFILTFSRKQ